MENDKVIKLKNILSESIDSLGFSSKISSEDKKRLKDPKGIFEKFPIDQFKSTPPPKNSSNETFKELLKIEKIPDDNEFTNRADKIISYFEEYVKALGLEFPKDELKELLKNSSPIIYQLKYYYNRPRPEQLAKELGYKFHEQPLKSSKTPAYPSGHAAQGCLIGNYLSKIYPENKADFMKLSDDISRSRLIGKVHYPSDAKFGMALGKALFDYMDKIFGNLSEASPNSKKTMKHKRKDLPKNATKDHERTTFMMGIGSKARTKRKKEIEKGKKYPAKDAPKKAYDPKSFRSDFTKGKDGKLKRRKTKPSQFNKKFDKMYGKTEENTNMKKKKNILLDKQSFSDKFDKMYGENSWKTVKEVWKMGRNNLVEKAGIDKALQNKAKLSGMPKGILKKVYSRGLAAWKVGHKPGAPQHAWAMGRVNSFATKSPGTWGKADKDLAKKVKG
tara:strand:+ start:938 stop:2275 length:1338 start_codon:yes stop_codon:yes gene_type:complete